MNNQSVPRDSYEILWIEYYSRVSHQIQKGRKKYSTSNKPPLLDQWIVMGMPENSGPYEMTFRLINSGKREIWHEQEYIYHVWHPGTEEISNYSGPNDSSNLSTTALKIRETGYILPLDENPAIKAVRQGLSLYAVQQEKFKDWTIK